jgi:hypothetical protein
VGRRPSCLYRQRQAMESWYGCFSGQDFVFDAAATNAHFFHRLVIADSTESALAEARRQLMKGVRNSRIVHQAASLRSDSSDAEEALLGGWKLRDGWWTRPIRPGDNLAAVAAHGYVTSQSVNARNTAGCVAIDLCARQHRPALPPSAFSNRTVVRPLCHSSSG